MGRLKIALTSQFLYFNQHQHKFRTENKSISLCRIPFNCCRSFGARINRFLYWPQGNTVIDSHDWILTNIYTNSPINNSFPEDLNFYTDLYPTGNSITIKTTPVHTKFQRSIRYLWHCGSHIDFLQIELSVLSKLRFSYIFPEMKKHELRLFHL